MYEYYDDGYEYSKTPQAKYDKANTTFISLRCDNVEDADILRALDGKPKQTWIKKLIRLGIEKLRTEDKILSENILQSI